MQRTEKYFESDAFRKTAAGVILAAEADAKTGGGRIALDGTVFYPEGGGQPADRGTLTLADGTVLTVTDVHEQAVYVPRLPVYDVARGMDGAGTCHCDLRAAGRLLGLLQRRPGRLLGRGFKAVVHLFIVIFHGSALLFGVSVQKSGSGRSSIWLTRFNDSLRRIYGWKRKLISTKSGALPTSPIVVLHPACRMAARQAS